MKQQKKSKFFTFIFSFIPGAAEMYMGFLKQRISLMALFIVCLAITLSLQIWPIEMLSLSAIVIWFYGFFHARNLAALPQENFEALEDYFIWEGLVENRKFEISSPTIRKWAAAILIVIGAVMIWDNFSATVYHLIPNRYWDEVYPIIDRIPSVVIAVLIIVIGFRLMAGKKEELNGDER
jgi:hypothetical protein